MSNIMTYDRSRNCLALHFKDAHHHHHHHHNHYHHRCILLHTITIIIDILYYIQYCRRNQERGKPCTGRSGGHMIAASSIISIFNHSYWPINVVVSLPNRLRFHWWYTWIFDLYHVPISWTLCWYFWHTHVYSTLMAEQWRNYIYILYIYIYIYYMAFTVTDAKNIKFILVRFTGWLYCCLHQAFMMKQSHRRCWWLYMNENVLTVLK